MRFADPEWLWIGAASVAVLLILLVRAERLRSRALSVLLGSRVRAVSTSLPSAFRRWLRVAVMAFAVAMGFTALARPQKGMHWETMERKGTDLLLVVDTSRSMDTDDVKPTRLERVKLAIRDLVERFPGDRIGLVAFAGDAFVQSPLTLDHDALLQTVDVLDTSIVARGGTNIGRAIDVATSALSSEPGHAKEMVLLTDGEDLEGRGVEEAKKAGIAGVSIDTVGVGSIDGEIVPARDDKGSVVGVVEDETGTPVRSKLDEAGLRDIASAAHGTYTPLGADGQGLERLYQTSLAPRARVEASSRTRRVYSERYQIPLGLALFAVVFDSLLGARWRRRATWKKRAPLGALTASAASVFLLAFSGRALASVSSAARSYAAGHFDEAARDYAAASAKDPKDVRLAFNAGDAAYRAKQYDAAKKLFDRALGAADPKIKEHVFYNEGDDLYRAGEETVESTREKTIDQWKAAITAYDGALGLDPKDEDARFNRDFVKRKLVELQKKQQDAQENKQKKDEQDQKRDQKSGSGDGQASKGKDGKSGAESGNKKDDGSNGASTGDKGDKRSADANGVGNMPKSPPPSPAPGARKPTNGQNDGAAANGSAPKNDGNPPRPGELSPRDARALLGALKGEERHRVSASTSDGKAVEDAPRKDW